MTLTNCTVSGNIRRRCNGGGLYAFNTFALRLTSTTLTNCTVSGNSAGSDGGGVKHERTKYNCTTQHAAGAAQQISNATMTIGNTIVAREHGRHQRARCLRNRCLPGQQPDRQDRRQLRLGRLRPDRHHRHAAQPPAGRPGQLRRPDPDDGPAARQPGHRRGQQRPHSRRRHHRPARPAPHRQQRRGHRRLRVERVHHRRHLGKRPVHGRAHGLRRPAGRDGHRQQPERARGGGPGHLHPAGERGVGDPDVEARRPSAPPARRASRPRPTASPAATPSRPRPAASRPPRASA